MNGTGAGGEIKGTFCQGSHMNPKRQLSQGSWVRHLSAATALVKGVSLRYDGRLAKIALVNKHNF